MVIVRLGATAQVESLSRSMILSEHDFFGKAGSYFPDLALTRGELRG
jgi:hypothetical protein